MRTEPATMESFIVHDAQPLSPLACVGAVAIGSLIGWAAFAAIGWGAYRAVMALCADLMPIPADL